MMINTKYLCFVVFVVLSFVIVVKNPFKPSSSSTPIVGEMQNPGPALVLYDKNKNNDKIPRALTAAPPAPETAGGEALLLPSGIGARKPKNRDAALVAPCVNDEHDEKDDFWNTMLPEGSPPFPLRHPCVAIKQEIAVASMSFKLTRLSLLDLIRTYHDAETSPWQVLLDATNHPAFCAFSLLQTENCAENKESFAGCVLRLGVTNVDNILVERCFYGKFWQTYRMELLKNSSSSSSKKSEQVSWKKLRRGLIPESQWERRNHKILTMMPSTVQSLYHSLPLATPYADPVRCGGADGGMKSRVIHPISHGIPASIILDDTRVRSAHDLVRYKSLNFFPVVPHQIGDYTHRQYWFNKTEEGVFRTMYQMSYFAFDNKRLGWDAMRHYEQLASGTLPIFPEAPLRPPKALSHLPWKYLNEAMELPGLEHLDLPLRSYDPARWSEKQKKFITPISGYPTHVNFSKVGTVNASHFDRGRYGELAYKTLQYTRRYLSCGSVAASLLQRIFYWNSRTKQFDKKYLDMVQQRRMLEFPPSEDALLQNNEEREARRLRKVRVDNMDRMLTRQVLESGQAGKKGPFRILFVQQFGYNYLASSLHNGFAELGLSTNLKLTIVGIDSWRYEPFKKKRPPLDELSEVRRGRRLAKLPGIYAHSFVFQARTFHRDGKEDEIISETRSASLRRRIERKEFDLVVIGYCRPHPESEASTPYWNAISKYPKEKIAWIETDDRGYSTPYAWPRCAENAGMMFQREMDEEYSCQG